MRVSCVRLLAVASLLAVAVPAAAQAQPADAPSAEALTPPELVTFVQADYPPEALAQKVTGEVVLSLDIDAMGKVTNATVETPAGHGFDEAARLAALGFVFRPAMRDATAVRSRILYRYAFTLSEAPAAAEPAAPVLGRLTGVVVAGEEEPVVGAEILLELSDGRALRLATDAMGRWSADEVPPGPVSVRVDAAGYEPWAVRETVQGGEELETVYRLKVAGALEVNVRGEKQQREVTRRTMERKELALVPGTGGDALKAIQTMPGVARPPGMSGLLVVRGSGPTGTQTFVDGSNVPMLYHFGGLNSVVPTEMIEAIDFYPGNFSVRYGRVTGGIVDVRLRELDHDGTYHGLAQVDLIDARLMLRGPVPLLKNWDFVVAGRRSHVDAWIKPLLEGSAGIKTAPVYYDWQAFLETRPSERSKFRVGVFGSDDRLAFVLKDALSVDPGIGNSFKSENRMLRLQATYRNEVSERLSLEGSASVGSDSDLFRVGAMFLDADMVPVSVRGELAYKPASWVTLRLGPDIEYYRIQANIHTTQPPDPGQPEPGPYSTQPLLSYNRRASFSRPAAFAELELKPSERASVLLGLRADYFNRTERLDVSPRMNARYDLRHGFPRTTLKAGLGLFYQPPDPVQVAEGYGTNDLRSNRALHYAAGIEQELSRDVELSVEGFYKEMSDLVMQAPLQDGALSYANSGDGEVVGAETLLKWKPTKRFFGWVAYTLSRATRRNAPGEDVRLFEYDQTHILTVLGSYELGAGWRAGGRFRYVSGNPYTPCTGGVLQAGAGVYTCKSGPLLSERLPAFHQLDVRLDKTWTFEDWKLSTYLDVQNAYNRGNPEAVVYNYRFTETRHQSGLPIIPSLGLRGEF